MLQVHLLLFLVACTRSKSINRRLIHGIFQPLQCIPSSPHLPYNSTGYIVRVHREWEYSRKQGVKEKREDGGGAEAHNYLNLIDLKVPCIS